MRDLFDEFMEELRRRQAEAEGRGADGPRDDGDGDEPRPDDADHDAEHDAEHDADAGAHDADRPPAEDATDADRDAERPEPLADRRRRRPTRRGAGRVPPGDRGPREPSPGPGRGRLVALVAVALVAVALLLFLGVGVDLWTDAIWYQSVGYASVFWTRLGTQWWLFIGVFVASLVVLLGNLWLAGRLAPPPAEGGGSLRTFMARLSEAAREADRGRRTWGGPIEGPWGPGGGPGGPRAVTFEREDVPDLTPVAVVIILGLGILFAIGLASAASDAWETFLLWLNQVPYAPAGSPAVTDPIFHKDIGFFLFELPFLRLVQSLLNGLLLAALLVAGARYLAGAARGGLVFPTSVRVHLAALGGLYLLTVAAGYQLDKLELAYSMNGGVAGVSYTDHAARFFAFDTLTVIAALAAAFLVGGAFTRWVWPLGAAVVVWFGASIILGTLYPQAVQRFVVDPNTYPNEQPYITNNINMSRLAYALDQWQEQPYSGDTPLTAQAIQDEAPTFTNARLWDYRPLGTTIDQLQTVRQYYDFVDVDTDRYTINGQERQVMLSARELDLPKSNITQNWLNTRIIYTHGIGLVMTPVNEVVGQGQPRLWIRDLPPVSSNGAPEITQPRIYFGEATSDYIVIGAKQNEFDYPRGGEDQTSGANQGAETRWTGTSGIKIDSVLTRLLFAARFKDLNLLISDQVTNQSQLLFHRALQDRLPRIAPFLKYDKDPYLVVTNDGRLVYIQDAYTVSDKFPHADPFDPTQLQGTGLGSAPFDYIRNSVKIVVDAYTGQTTFYVADPSDPIIRAYEGVFPELFKPLDAMPADLRAHLRYPEELFNVQTREFGRYHVTNPLTFFQRDDLWAVPSGTTSEQTLPPEAYYVVMRLPGTDTTQFLLLQPMVPTDRPNMIAWVAAGNDGAEYGKVTYYKFPSNTTVFGPAQVDGLIDQDPTISSQITLWSQAGSNVIRGNLLVLPVGDSVIYLQPVYLQSTGSSFPEFQKIVVASPYGVVWADTLQQALADLLASQGSGPSPSPGPSPAPSPGPSSSPSPSAGPGPTPPAGDVAALIAYANQHFELAQQALRSGDFATYGAEMDKVQQALQALAKLTASPTPSAPVGSPSPGPSSAP